MGARGLVDEASKMMQEAATDGIRDTVIVSGATKAEHYEMIACTDLIDAAEMLKLRKAEKLLTENRDQEVSTARKLERLGPKLAQAAA